MVTELSHWLELIFNIVWNGCYIQCKGFGLLMFIIAAVWSSPLRNIFIIYIVLHVIPAGIMLWECITYTTQAGCEVGDINK